jgi:hypothetical protein
MEAPFSIISPCIFLDKALRVGKAWDDIREVDAVPAHIALPLRFIPFKPHGLLYVQSVCPIKYCLKLALQAQAVCRENLKLFMGVGVE